MKKNKSLKTIILLMAITFFSNKSIFAQTDSIPLSQISTDTVFVLHKNTAPVNTKIIINHFKIDISTMVVVDGTNTVLPIAISKFAYLPNPDNLPYTLGEISFSSVANGTYYLKGVLNGNSIYYKIIVTE